MKVMAGRKYDIASIITHEFRQDELAEALELAGRPDEALNVIIRYEN